VTAILVMTKTDARRLTARIRDVGALHDDLLVQALEGRAWAALGHESFEAYCAAELPELRMLKMRPAPRRARAKALRAADPNVTLRDIAAATGSSPATAMRDLRPEDFPSTPAGRGLETGDFAGMTRAQETLARLKAAGERGLTSTELDAATTWPMGTATGTLSKLERRGLVHRPGHMRGQRGAYVAR
jgi:hypothetical protein